MAHAIKFNTTQDNGFFLTLRQRVRDDLAARGKTRYADGFMLFKATVFVLLLASSYAAIFINPIQSVWSQLGFAMLYGLAALLLVTNLAHDAVHQALTPSKTVNRWVQIITFGFLGVDGTLWQLRHNQAHHVIPNVEGGDSAVTRNPLLRLSPHQPWERKHAWQHLYAPLAYSIIVLHSAWRQDFLYITNRKRLTTLGAVDYGWQDYAVFALTKVIYITTALVLPFMLLDLPWWQIMIGYMSMSMVVSAAFVYLLVGTHFCEEAEFPEADQDGVLPYNWAYHAMVTSADWSPYSRVAQFLIGGTNAHATHHLFPRICHTHYRSMAPIIEATANEFDVPYNKLTLPEMLRSHFRFLREMGQRPAEPVRSVQAT
ncbi:MAG: fatty acid desaturase [Rhodothermales bacterium]|nr:fatty acid desaturase [Rhodothermales bacterium]MBO6778142.1 fatty acid desaturase [Rhodothermales bacterium]